MGWQRQVDTRALEIAAGVARVQERHEEECTRRYQVLDNGIVALRGALEESRREREASSRRLYGMMWKTAAAMISMLLLIIGYLLTHSAPFAVLFNGSVR